MNEHKSIYILLPLAAADALSRQELSIVEEHAGTCPECRHELEVLRLYSRGLRQLPQPIVPAGLLQRTSARLDREHAESAEKREHDLTLGLLALFCWATGIVFWIVVRLVTGGVWKVFGTNLVAVGTWYLISGLLSWVAAGVAVVVLRKRGVLARGLS